LASQQKLQHEMAQCVSQYTRLKDKLQHLFS